MSAAPASSSPKSAHQKDVELLAQLRLNRQRDWQIGQHGFRNQAIGQIVGASEKLDKVQVEALLKLLQAEGAFSIKTESHVVTDIDGQTSTVTIPRAAETGMWPMGTNVWIRDLSFIAARMLSASASGLPVAQGLAETGKQLLLSGLTLMSTITQQKRFEAILASNDPAHIHTPHHWPHIFLEILPNLNGATTEKWSHKQDAWQILAVEALRAIENKQLSADDLTPNHRRFFSYLVPFLARVEYWQNESSGSWEELPAVRSSVMIWELVLLQKLIAAARQPEFEFLRESYTAFRSELPLPYRKCSFEIACRKLAVEGAKSLAELLPYESPTYASDDPRYRKPDIALAYHLFLDGPLVVADWATLPTDWAARVQHAVAHMIDSLEEEESKAYKRYLGDSYQGLNYFTYETVTRLKEICGAPSGDASGLKEFVDRQNAIVPGHEAAWCHPIWQLAAVYGKRFRQTGDPTAQAQQHRYLLAGLRNITGVGEWSLDKLEDDTLRLLPIPPFRFPECLIALQDSAGSYRIPSPHTPLNWCTAEALGAFAELWQSF